jgi:hypothetical protein
MLDKFVAFDEIDLKLKLKVISIDYLRNLSHLLKKLVKIANFCIKKNQRLHFVLILPVKLNDTQITKI